MAQVSTLALVVFLSTFLLLLTTGEAAQCFLCSWSPNNKANRTDHCTRTNFDREKTFVLECEHGCEFFSQTDLNGDFEHVRRNCAPHDPSHKGCLTETSRGWTTVRCVCSSDYCNSAPDRRTSASLVLLALFLGLAAATRMPT